MSKIIYRTGASMRAEYYQTHPNHPSARKPIKSTTKHFFRGTPVAQLLDGKGYSYFQCMCHEGYDDETAYLLTQQHIIKMKGKKHGNI